jgi:RHS repeat-associated protein
VIRIANTEPTSIFAFTGRPLDKEAGLQLNQLRHFDPAVGRWLDDEPVGYHGDANLHHYPANRPQ